MVMVCKNLGIAYYAIPKVACTSIKSCLHELEHGAPFERAASGKTLHATYPSRQFDRQQYALHADLWKFAVVREPIRRLLSAFTNKGGQLGWVEVRRQNRKEAAKGLFGLFAGQKRKKRGKPDALPDSMNGLSLTPDPNEFFEQFPAYFETFHVVRQHTYPHAYFLGDDLRRFDKVYRIEALTELETDLSERLGQNVTVPRSNPSDRKITLDELSPKAVRVLHETTRADYEFLRDFYERPEAA